MQPAQPCVQCSDLLQGTGCLRLHSVGEGFLWNHVVLLFSLNCFYFLPSAKQTHRQNSSTHGIICGRLVNNSADAGFEPTPSCGNLNKLYHISLLHFLHLSKKIIMASARVVLIILWHITYKTVPCWAHKCLYLYYLANRSLKYFFTFNFCGYTVGVYIYGAHEMFW